MDFNRNKTPNNDSGDGKRPKANIWVALIITVAIILIISTIFNAISNSQYTAVTYDHFRNAMLSGQVAEVQLQGDRVLHRSSPRRSPGPCQRTGGYGCHHQRADRGGQLHHYDDPVLCDHVRADLRHHAYGYQAAQR